jgi:Holliday junction resolvase-like predicted endonuclease
VPSQALKGVKQRHIARAALSFIKEKNLWDKKARFDVVCVQGAIDGTQQIELIKNAFELVGRFSY